MRYKVYIEIKDKMFSDSDEYVIGSATREVGDFDDDNGFGWSLGQNIGDILRGIGSLLTDKDKIDVVRGIIDNLEEVEDKSYWFEENKQ
jgi:hypothetical protein